MPKLKNPLFSQEARGGLGGLVYNTWRGISYVKTNTSPTGQGTAKRLAAQAILATIAKLWQGISDIQRAAWNQYAIDHPVLDSINGTKRLTGMNWFCSCNVQLALQGAATITEPPAAPAPDAPTGVTMRQNGLDLEISWTTPVAATLNIIFWLVGPISAGVTAKIEQAKYQLTSAADAEAPIVLKAAAPAGRYTVFARAMDPATGLCSQWVSAYLDMT